MIYITGDCHGDFWKLSPNVFYEQKEMTKDDYLIICGDFGGIWYPEGSDNALLYEKKLDWLNSLPFTTLFVDGNHECVNKHSDVLTENGWMNIKEAYESNIKIANVDMQTHELSFDYPLEKIKKYSNEIIDIIGVNFKQSVTPNHDVFINQKKIKAKELLNRDVYEEELRYGVKANESGISLSPILIEIITAVVMDATIVDYSKYNPNSHKIRIQFH